MREPEFIGGEVDFRINIYRGQINAYSADKVNNGSQISITGTDYADKVPEKCRDSADKLPKNEQERLIYKYVLENESITTAQATELLGIKQRRTRDILVKMIENNWLQKKGASRSTAYIVNPERI